MPLVDKKAVTSQTKEVFEEIILGVFNFPAMVMLLSYNKGLAKISKAQAYKKQTHL